MYRPSRRGEFLRPAGQKTPRCDERVDRVANVPPDTSVDRSSANGPTATADRFGGDNDYEMIPNGMFSREKCESRSISSQEVMGMTDGSLAISGTENFSTGRGQAQNELSFAGGQAVL